MIKYVLLEKIKLTLKNYIKLDIVRILKIKYTVGNSKNKLN